MRASSKGGRAGQWSARKAQLAVQKYKARGGKYCGKKTKAQKSLTKWTKQEWGSDRKGDRYLPKKARKALSDAEYRKTSAKKRKDTAKGKQFSKQPKRIAKKTAKYRKNPMSRRQKQQYMAGFGAAVLSEDYGGVPEGWGLQQMCGAGFGGRGHNFHHYWSMGYRDALRRNAARHADVDSYRNEAWKTEVPTIYHGGSPWKHASWQNKAYKHGWDDAGTQRSWSPGAPGGHRDDPKFGQGPWPGVDTAVQGGIQEYALNWGNAALDVAEGNVTEAEIDAEGPDGAEAVVAMQSAVNALWGAAGQLQQTQRGRAQGGRSRHRRLVKDARLLLATFFRGATDETGAKLSWRDVVGDLPATSIGPAQFTFGKKKIPTFVPVQAEGGVIRISIPSILTAKQAIDLADDVVSTANAIRNLAFTWQSRGQGAPQIPSDFIMRSLSQQSSIIPSNVFTVGGTFGGGYNDGMYAQNQLERTIAVANAASDLIEQGTPLMSWQKGKIAVAENDLRGVLQGLQAIKNRG